MTFEQGVPPRALLQGFLLGSRPGWAAHLRAAYTVPGLETDRVVAMWHPPFPHCCMAILCKMGVLECELSAELVLQSQPFHRRSAHWPDKLLDRALMRTVTGITSSMGLACGHRWRRRCFRERSPKSGRSMGRPLKRRNAKFAIAAHWGGLLFWNSQIRVSNWSRECSCLYLIRRDCG